MSIGILGDNAIAYLAVDQTTANESNSIATQIDLGQLGMPQNGTLIVVLDYASTGTVSNFDVWTSSSDVCLTTTVAGNSDAGTGRIKVRLTSDVDTLRQVISNESDTYAMVVSGNTITTVGAYDQAFAITCKDLRRYLNCQWDCDGTSSGLTILFVGHDLMKSPQNSAGLET